MSTNDFPAHVLPALAILAAAAVTLHLTTHRSKKEVTNDIKATLKDGFCGHNNILISRLPLPQSNASSCATLLGLFHEQDTQVTVHGDSLISSKKSWEAVVASFGHSRVLPGLGQFSKNAHPYKLSSADGSYDFYTIRGNGTHAVEINRATLITILILSNARTIYEYSDSSGYRGAFGSWTGQWYINWRAGQPAVVTLKPHDSHSPATDVYPPTFPARVDRCVQMMAGVVVDAATPGSFSVAFPGRLAPGHYRLKHQKNGFGLSHGSRHIYNMNGGKVFEIDFLFPQPMEYFEVKEAKEKYLLTLPSTKGERDVSLHVSEEDYLTLCKALDDLPWANLSWSMHRGMRDLLLEVAADHMNTYRDELAQRLRDAARTHHPQLVNSGWNSDFAKHQMGEMAASAVLAGRGNSGDAVRIVTALAEQIHGGTTQERDTTSFWENIGKNPRSRLEPDDIVALVKVFVLEWSQEFNYQMYHQLPITLLFG
ncbi:hypothetical protein P171DRAFT_486975 [Karstenula rhodostoma CBS 690.94]|uniref:Uncharacterized protein n=1 Tax=Karstenula rhodostoma CBS 690.94 TaxID=1392251 RepID=A0A9P4UBD8_9PLEO|nr:hypothetical protein P171DRAFT_486975 [Karstenula rhodostoma CBS 690.94]